MAATDEWPQVTPRETRVTYVPGSWHNPTSEPLRKLFDDVWVMERGYVDHGVDVGAKATILRLPDDRLVVYSCLPITRELKETIDTLGTVSAVVAPNTQHVDFVKCWKKYYPNATCLAPPGLKATREDVPFDDELSTDGTPHESYKDDAATIKQVYLGDSCPIMGETVFFHVPSKTLLVTDLIFTFPSDNLSYGTRFAKFFLGNVFTPIQNTFLVKDKKAYQDSLRSIEAFEFINVVPCHGEIILDDGMAVFKQWHGHS